MPSSRASRRAYRMSSNSGERSLRVAGEAEQAARAKAKSGDGNSSATKSGKASPKGKSSSTRPQGGGRAKAPSGAPTAIEWSAAFTALARQLDPVGREELVTALERLQPGAVSTARARTFTAMREAIKRASRPIPSRGPGR